MVNLHHLNQSGSFKTSKTSNAKIVFNVRLHVCIVRFNTVGHITGQFSTKCLSRFIRDDPVSFIQLPAGSAGNLHQTGKHLPKGKGYSFLYRLVQINMTQ